MQNINDIADYIIFRLNADDNTGLANLKLQKLLYYIQSWHLAFYDKPLFDGKFQAWVHGPVNRDIYNRFKDSKNLYSDITLEDLKLKDFTIIPEAEKKHIDIVLEGYAKFSGVQLEIMTHQEDPWIKARIGYNPTQRCENEIDENLMLTYYKQRL